MPAACIFHIGKGGVGKSTISALTALAAAEEGKRVLLLSLDPAHNQSDLFQQDFGDVPKRVHRECTVMEADMDRWIQRYLDEVQQRMRDAYTYLSALNLEHHFRVLRHSPGLEEFALRRVFEHVRAEARDLDLLVVDMPPTALATRFFASPTITATWTEALLTLRREIKDKREMITRVKLGKKEIEADRVLNTLKEELRRSRILQTFFSDANSCAVRLVLNPDPLSWNEGLRIQSALTELGIPLDALLLNKADEGDDAVPETLAGVPLRRIPRFRPSPLSLPSLLDSLRELPAELR